MKLLKNTSVFLLSLLICYNASAATLSIHFCGNKVSNVSFFDKSDCGMAMQSCPSSKNEHKQAVKKTNDCCKNLLLKNKTKVQSFEKAEKSNLGSNLTKASFPLYSQALASTPFHLRQLNYINPHPQWEFLSPKNSIYLVVQNFRN